MEGTFTIFLEDHGSLNDSWQRRSEWPSTWSPVGASRVSVIITIIVIFSSGKIYFSY